MRVRTGRRLPRGWFERSAPSLAPDLLGRVLVRHLPGGGDLAVRIVETEAYTADDPASHAFRGPTARNAVMFGPAGHVYVYLTYGTHHCMNVVAGTDGVASAVLVRAAEPLSGLDRMAEARGLDAPRLLTSGPGRLCQALGIDRTLDGADLLRGGALSLHEGTPVPRRQVAVSTRVGIRVGTDLPWRFSVSGDPFVSRARGAGDPPRRRLGPGGPAERAGSGAIRPRRSGSPTR